MLTDHLYKVENFVCGLVTQLWKFLIFGQTHVPWFLLKCLFNQDPKKLKRELGATQSRQNVPFKLFTKVLLQSLFQLVLDCLQLP